MKKKILIFIASLIIVAAALIMITTLDTAPPQEGEYSGIADDADGDYPRILSITPESTGFTVRWSAYPGADSYALYVKGSSGWVEVGRTDLTAMLLTDLTDRQEYTYTVRALDQGGAYLSDFREAGWSSVFRSAPELISVAPGGNALEIRWEPIPDVSCYHVYRRNGAEWLPIGSTADTSYFDTDVISGNTYSYRIRAYDPEQNRAISAYQARGMSSLFVSMPVITDFEVSNTGVSFTWDSVVGAAKYRVFVRTQEGWKGLDITEELSYTDRNPASDTESVYTVRAMNEDGVYVSDFARDGCGYSCLPAPRMISLSNAYGGQKLSWGKVSGAQLYRVYVKRDGEWEKLADTSELSYLAAECQNGSSYTYTVRCVTPDGASYLSGFNTSGMTARYYEAPVLSSVESRNDGVHLSWQEVKGADRYRVFVMNGSAWVKLADVRTNSYTHPFTEQGKTYTYTVRALDYYGRYISGYQTEGRSVNYQTAPIFREIQPSAGGIKLTWDIYDGVEAYRIYRRELGGSWKGIADVNGTSYVDKGAPAGVPYQYTLRSLDASGNTISDYVADETFYCDGALADGEIVANDYVCIFDKGTVVKGYITPQDIIKVAMAEVGTQATDIKCCKYNTWYWGYEVSGDCYDWCVIFVQWVFDQANASELLYERNTGCEFFGMAFNDRGRLVMSDFQVGDLILLHWEDRPSSFVPGVKLLNHVGIVIAVNDDGSVTTIEGNTGDNPNGEVMIKTRYPELISCACRPEYGFYLRAEDYY